MSLDEDVQALRRRLKELAGEAEDGLARRYALKPLPWERPNLYVRSRKAVGRMLRRLGLRSAAPLEPWLAGLKHVAGSEDAKTFVIWALGSDRETLREACRGFERGLAGVRGWAPVLVTDVADFAFFSRLGWLVEFVPVLSAPGDRYAERKRRYLARRYADAPALPVSAGLNHGVRLEELLGD